MPRRTFCQHPTRHSNSDVAPKSQRSVSLQLAKFIRDRYDLDDDDVTEFCAKCHAFECQQMEEDEDMEVEKNTSSNDDMPDEDEQEQEQEEEEEEEEEKDNKDDEMSDQDGDSSGDSLHELTYQQQEAMDTLSNVFRMLNMSSIHDQ